MQELKSMHDNLPEYFSMLQGMEERLGQMKSKPLSVIGVSNKYKKSNAYQERLIID